MPPAMCPNRRGRKVMAEENINGSAAVFACTGYYLYHANFFGSPI